MPGAMPEHKLTSALEQLFLRFFSLESSAGFRARLSQGEFTRREWGDVSAIQAPEPGKGRSERPGRHRGTPSKWVALTSRPSLPLPAMLPPR